MLSPDLHTQVVATPCHKHYAYPHSYMQIINEAKPTRFRLGGPTEMSEEEGAKLKVALRYVVIVTRHIVLKNKNMSKMKINKHKKYICICK